MPVLELCELIYSNMRGPHVLWVYSLLQFADEETEAFKVGVWAAAGHQG